MADDEHPLARAVDEAVEAAQAAGTALGELARVLARQIPDAGMAAAAISKELRATLTAIGGDDDDSGPDELETLFAQLGGPR